MIAEKDLVIQTHSLQFSFGNLEVLRNIDLEVPAGSIYGFLGPNGAGKSTTIKALLGLLQVKEGMVNLFGKDLTHHRLEILSRIGAMVESPSLYDHLNARRNLDITRRLRSLPLTRIDEVLDIVNLSADAGRPVRQYSTGMKQRLSLAIALLGKPDLLILDEPINGLDPTGIIEMRNLLNSLNREMGCTIFLSSHILDEIEKICTHVAVINKGHILYQGNMKGFLHQYSQKDRMLIETADNVKGAEILAAKGALLEGDFISIPFKSKSEVAEMIRVLTSASIDVYSAGRDRNDLESSFLEILQEGGVK
jgi:lantibiotic transport system ATP-binding protein